MESCSLQVELKNQVPNQNQIQVQIQIQIQKVVLWGHKLHSHTHSYIHNAYYRAFKSMGYVTEWYDDNDNVDNVDFANCLFITEHQVDNRIPKRTDCLYILHFLDMDGKYDSVPLDNIIELQCSYRDHKENAETILFNKHQHSYYKISNNHLIYYTLWGTDLLPNEIDDNIKNIDFIMAKRTKIFNFVGSPVPMWQYVFKYLISRGVEINHLGGVWYRRPALNEIEHMQCIQESVMAPAFQDDQQIGGFYVPCRIFKNISYGRMGITNNPLVQKILNNKLIYNSNIPECLNLALKFENQLDINDKKTKILELMTLVKNDHTYISRIEDLQNFIQIHTKFRL